MGRYELMDLVSGNFAGIYETEEEALHDVAAHIARFGRDAVEGLALGYNDYPESVGRLIAEGAELANLAHRAEGSAPTNGPATRRRPRARTHSP